MLSQTPRWGLSLLDRREEASEGEDDRHLGPLLGPSRMPYCVTEGRIVVMMTPRHLKRAMLIFLKRRQ